MRYLILVSLSLTLLMSGCKPKEVELYEQGIALYNQHGQQENGESILRQSGDMGYGKAFAYLAEKQMLEARNMRRFPIDSSFEQKIERLQNSLPWCDDAIQYLKMAKDKGGNDCDAQLARAEMLKTEIASQILLMRAEHEIDVADALIAEDSNDLKKSITKMKSAMPHYSSAIELYKKADLEHGCNVTQAISEVEIQIVNVGSKIINAEKEIIQRETERKDKIRNDKIVHAINEAKQLRLEIDSLCENRSKMGAKDILRVAKKLDGSCDQTKKLLADDEIRTDSRVKDEISSVGKAEVKLQQQISTLTEQIEKEKEEELKRQKEAERQRTLVAEEMERKQSADYCLENGLVLTVKAMTQIISSLDFSSDTGNKLQDKQNEARERGRFKGRNAYIKGKITKVDSAWLGGINVWIDSQGKRVKCCFGGMSKSDALQFTPGESLNVRGNIDGTGLWAEDLVLVNCKCL